MQERRIAVDRPDDWREVSEVFSSGTAAGAAHVREIVHSGRTLFARAEPGPIARTLGRALDAARFGGDEDRHRWRLSCAEALPREFELPFDAGRKRMSTVHRDGGTQVVFTKGAPESVVPSYKRILYIQP